MPSKKWLEIRGFNSAQEVNMRPPFALSSLFVFSVLLGNALPASAEIILPGVTYVGQIRATIWDALDPEFPSVGQPLTEFRISNEPVDSVFLRSTVAGYSSSLSPHPMLTASTSSFASSPEEDAWNSAQVTFVVMYRFEATGPGPVVPIHVTANSHGSGFLGVSLDAPPFSSILESPNGTWKMDSDFDVVVDQVYFVYLQVAAISEGHGFHFASSTLDALFTIDPLFPDANQYELLFSPGVGNEPFPPVPEPSTLVMLSSLVVSVCGVGGLRKWRKRTTAAV